MKKVILSCFATLFAFQVSAQLFTTIKIDTITQLEPIVMFDTTDFRVHLTVDDTGPLNIDSLLGDLFYFYQTDSMINSGTLPRLINLDLSVLWISASEYDTVPIDIRPNEIRTGPVNLIILWPAALTIIPNLLLDTIQDSLWIGGIGGFLNGQESIKHPQANIVYPVPSLEFLFIRPEEIAYIKEIKLLSMNGEMINRYQPSDFSSGVIDLKSYPSGTYFVEIYYKSSNTFRQKIIKP